MLKNMFVEGMDYFRQQILNGYKLEHKDENEESSNVLIIIPGFMTNEKPFESIIEIAKEKGYKIITLKDILSEKKKNMFWKRGYNIGWSENVLELINTKIKKIKGEGKKITLMGWSLGGYYTRMIDEKVYKIINITSPTKSTINENCTIGWLYKIITKRKIVELDSVLKKSKEKSNINNIVNYVALKDGLLNPEICMVEDSKYICAHHINILKNRFFLDYIKNEL